MKFTRKFGDDFITLDDKDIDALFPSTIKGCFEGVFLGIILFAVFVLLPFYGLGFILHLFF